MERINRGGARGLRSTGHTGSYNDSTFWIYHYSPHPAHSIVPISMTPSHKIRNPSVSFIKYGPNYNAMDFHKPLRIDTHKP